jgi:ABC-type uncharacterized transport system substrate-binding protein
MISRREFLTAAAGVVLVTPRVAATQPRDKVWRIGVLANEPWSAIDGLRDGLRQAGYVDGQTIRLEYRWFQGRPERLPTLAADLVRMNVDVIVTVASPATLAAKHTTTIIPIVMNAVGDPVGARIVPSLAHPDGNVTGVSFLAAELEPKRLELLKESMPNRSRVGVLWNPTNPYNVIATKNAQRAAPALGLSLELVPVRSADDLDRAFATLARFHPEATLVIADQVLLSQRQRIAEYMTRNRLPIVSSYREHVDAGGLLSYATNSYESFRLVATFVDKILKGAKPADLPVEQPTKFELVVNMKTAKALGLTIPPSLLLRADHVIE